MNRGVERGADARRHDRLVAPFPALGMDRVVAGIDAAGGAPTDLQLHGSAFKPRESFSMSWAPSPLRAPRCPRARLDLVSAHQRLCPSRPYPLRHRHHECRFGRDEVGRD